MTNQLQGTNTGITIKQEGIINHIILIDRISSGKENIFSFYYKKDMIDTTPFQKKTLPGYYNYNHHFNRNDLLNLSKTILDLFPRELSKERHGRELTTTGHSELIINNLIKHFENGTFNRMIDRGEKIINLQIIWKGKPSIPNFTPTEMKETKPKEKKEKIDLGELSLI